MLSESNKQDETTNMDITKEKKSMTFKDWKILKQASNNNGKLDNGTKSGSGNRFNNNFNAPRNQPRSGYSNHFSNYGSTGNFLPFNNFNGNNNYKMFGGVGGNDCFNNFNPHYNNLNCRNNVGFNISNNFKNSNGFSNFKKSGEFQNFFKNNRNDYNGFNGRINNNRSNSANFFTSDCVYPQKDEIQKPLPNPFRQFDNFFQKEKNSRNKGQKKNYRRPIQEKNTDYSRNQPKEPEVYVLNPKTHGKPYIPKPKMPESNLELSKEEKKQQWKDYRQAMKPFKNKDFHNAKRVVQRLGKMSLSELDEKQIFRLTNAKEYIATYKAGLAVKYPGYYVKAEDSSDNLGELFVLKEKHEINSLINNNECNPNSPLKGTPPSLDTN